MKFECSAEFLRILAQVSGLIFLNVYLRVQRIILQKSIFVWARSFCLYHCWILKEVFIKIILIFSEELSILRSRFSEKYIHKSFSFKIFQNYLLYLEFWANFCRQVCHKSCRQMNNFSYIFFRMKLKFFHTFELWTKKWVFAELFPRQFCKICSLRVRMNCLIIWRRLFPGFFFVFSDND